MAGVRLLLGLAILDCDVIIGLDTMLILCLGNCSCHNRDLGGMRSEAIAGRLLAPHLSRISFSYLHDFQKGCVYQGSFVQFPCVSEEA